MSSDFKLRATVDDASADGNLDIRLENTTGSSVLSAVLLGVGVHAGEYILTFTNSGGVTVAIAAETTKNPYHGLTGVAVTADGATVNKGIIDGIGIVVSAAVVTNHVAKIVVGDRMDGSAVITQYLGVGIVLSGASSAAAAISAVNVGADDGANCKIVPCPYFYPTGTNHYLHIASLRPHTSESREQSLTPGDLVVTYANYVPGAPDTVDVYVGGLLAIVGAKLDGTELYQHGTGNGYDDANDRLPGLGVIFADGGDPTSRTHTIHARKGYSWVQLAPDVSGSPGTWGTAGASMVLTESGQPAGDVTSGNLVLFHARTTVPSSESPQDVALSCLRVRHQTI